MFKKIENSGDQGMSATAALIIKKIYILKKEISISNFLVESMTLVFD